METRKPIICANFKLNLSNTETERYVSMLSEKMSGYGGVDVCVAPVVTTIYNAIQKSHNSKIQIGAQNVFHEPKGAFTGEWSVEHLKEIGCSFVIVGHSERRRYFAESDELVQKKVHACLQKGISPIACVGETFEERKAGKVEQVLKRQIEAIIDGCAQSSRDFVIAYEPVWAIGTGNTATLQDIRDAHGYIRDLLIKKMGNLGVAIRIIYGGSVTAENCAEIFSLAEVDGALVGGASLDVQKFCTILDAMSNRKVLV